MNQEAGTLAVPGAADPLLCRRFRDRDEAARAAGLAKGAGGDAWRGARAAVDSLVVVGEGAFPTSLCSVRALAIAKPCQSLLK